MLCCKDEDCGYVDHSELPASAKIGESTDEREAEVPTMPSMRSTSLALFPVEMDALRQLTF
jgi:hypothetical protein